MKRLLLLAIVVATYVSAIADLNGDGYYRVQNAKTKRYSYLLDNRGSFDVATSSADVKALKLYSDFLRASSDPSTVFFIKHADVAGSNIYYDIASQGTSIYGFMHEYLKIMSAGEFEGEPSYYAYATKSGMTKYLGDLRMDMSNKEGYASVDAKGDYRKWYIHPITTDSDEGYFGITPTVTAGGKYYHTLYADFPYKAHSDGMNFYKVTQVDSYNGIAVVETLDGVVPAGQAVIIECSIPLATDNRLDIGSADDKADMSGNILKGVYFDNESELHYNRTPFDKQSMRVLGAKDGKLAFVEGDYEFLPRNQAYLKLTDPSQYDASDFQLMTKEEYENTFGSVAVIPVTSTVDVYSLDGRLVRSGIAKDEVASLGSGLYILRSGGVSEKFIVR